MDAITATPNTHATPHHSTNPLHLSIGQRHSPSSSSSQVSAFVLDSMPLYIATLASTFPTRHHSDNTKRTDRSFFLATAKTSSHRLIAGLNQYIRVVQLSQQHFHLASLLFAIATFMRLSSASETTTHQSKHTLDSPISIRNHHYG